MSGIDSQPTRLSNVLNLKNSKTIWGTKSIFCYYWSYEKFHAILGYGPKKLFAESVCRIFYFSLVNLSTGRPLLPFTCFRSFWLALAGFSLFQVLVSTHSWYQWRSYRIISSFKIAKMDPFHVLTAPCPLIFLSNLCM